MFVYELGIWQSPSRGDRMNPDVLDHDVTRDCKSSKSLFRRSDGLDTFVEHLTSLVQRCCYFTLYPLEPLPGEYVVL
jgi:hypothetical protein